MPPKVKDAYAEANKRLGALIEYKLALYDVTRSKLAEVIGITERTLYRKFHKPEGFTLEELRVIFSLLRFTDAERVEAFRGKKQ